MGKIKRVVGLTISEKLQIIAAVNNKVDKKVLTAKYKCNRSTINRIIKNQADIQKSLFPIKRKRQRKGVHDLVEEALFKWFQDQVSTHARLDRHVILAKAKQLCVEFDDDFEPDANFLWRWRKRHNIKCDQLNGESASKDAVAATEHVREELPEVIKEDPADIFEADEIAILDRDLPSTSAYASRMQLSRQNFRQMSVVPLMFRDWWDELDFPMRTSRLLDQHFGTGMRRDDLMSSVWNSRPTMLRSGYLRPWQRSPNSLQKQESGSTLNIDNEKFEVILDVQQFSPNEITVKVADKFVIVEGKHEEKQDEHGFVARQFSRRYLLPSDVNPDSVTSSLSSDGLLTITAPMKNKLPPPPTERLIQITQTGPSSKEDNARKIETTTA